MERVVATGCGRCFAILILAMALSAEALSGQYRVSPDLPRASLFQPMTPVIELAQDPLQEVPDTGRPWMRNGGRGALIGTGVAAVGVVFLVDRAEGPFDPVAAGVAALIGGATLGFLAGLAYTATTG